MRWCVHSQSGSFDVFLQIQECTNQRFLTYETIALNWLRTRGCGKLFIVIVCDVPWLSTPGGYDKLGAVAVNDPKVVRISRMHAWQSRVSFSMAMKATRENYHCSYPC